jgi:ubiquinone biosynthesis accessory factor UbiK
MPKADFLKNLAVQLSDALPHVRALKKDVKDSCHKVLSSAFSKLDLVTREEFDIQTKVLLRTRKKIEELEGHLNKLDTLLKNKHRK